MLYHILIPVLFAKSDQLTYDETKLVEYARALADWLEPYHNYARPPPHVVLAEAVKQTELKTGHPLKGIEIHTTNATNGHPKKDEEPPTIQEPPEMVLNYFDGELDFYSLSTAPYCALGVRARINDSKAHSSPTELLHVATIAQEVGVLCLLYSSVFILSTSGFPSFCCRNVALQIALCRKTQQAE